MNARTADSALTHRFPWKWNLADFDQIPKNGKKVFSCFSCGGGSSMGYKLAGYEVIGNVEIDPRMEAVYKENHHPRHTFLMDIREFNKLEEIPEELKDLDILDGSPPCSSFSMNGQRQRGWGKDKVFREGQAKQRLDDLFFSYIETIKKLKPKVYVAENVEGLIRGKARGYVNEIVKELQGAGYTVQLFLLDASRMGVPQKRMRTFFIGHREEMEVGKLSLDFSEPEIRFGEVKTGKGKPIESGRIRELVSRRKPGDNKLSDISERERGKVSMYSMRFVDDDRPAKTATAGDTLIRFSDGLKLSDQDYINIQTFPQDYRFLGQPVEYITGMSVPPVMMAQVAAQIYEQWLR